MQVIDNRIDHQRNLHNFEKFMDCYKKTYKARFVHAETYASIFRYSNCVLPISVGQEYHEGDKLEAIIHLINNKFMSCTIVIADVLQRHTLMLENNLSEAEAENIATSIGKEWLASQAKYISKLNIPHKIKFWYEWLNSEAYQSQRLITESLYRNNQQIQSAFDLSIEKFLNRNPNFYNPSNQAFAKERALEYIKEECSIMPLWIKDKFHFEIYPANRNPAMVAIYDFLIKPYHPELLRWLRVKLCSRFSLLHETMPA